MRRVFYKEFPSRRFGLELELTNNMPKKEVGKALASFEAIYGRNKVVNVTDGELGWSDTCNNNYWHVKYDSTCGPLGKGKDYGWEVASFIGSGHLDVDNVARASRFLGSYGCTTNRNCG